MATGRLYTGSPALANNNYPTYVVQTGFYSVFNVSITNTTSAPITIKLALAGSASPQTSEYIESGAVIPPNGVFERTGLVGNAGTQVCYQASATGVNINIWGIETSTS